MIVHEPVAIPCEGGHAFGILARAVTEDRLTALVLPGAGNFGNGGPALLSVSRRLAASGCATLRLDYFGMGESTGGITRLRAITPRISDPRAAVDELRRNGHHELAIVGLCYGARAALATASDMPHVAGLAMLAPPLVASAGVGAGWSIGQLVRRMARPSRWRNLLRREHRRTYWYVIRRFVKSRLHRRGANASALGAPMADRDRPPDPYLIEMLRQLAARNVPVLMILGEVDQSLAELRRPSGDELRTLLTAGDSSIELVVVPGSVHSFRDPATIEAVTNALVDWTTRIASTLPAVPAA